jgi:hypothetical protein
VISFTPKTLYPWKRALGPILEKAEWAPNQYGYCGQNKKIPPIPGIKPWPSSSLTVPTPTELSGLHFRVLRLSLRLTKHYDMKTYRGVDVWIQVFLISALVGGEWLASCPCRFTPGERAPGTHWIGGWVDPRAGLNDTEN